MNIAVFGAAGAIGSVAVPELLRRGHRVRIVGRDVDRLRDVAEGAEPFAADLTQPDAARAAAVGVDAILFSAGVPYHHNELYVPMTRAALDGARAAGVRRFVQIGTVYPYGRPQTARVAETHPRLPHTRKGAWRKEQEDLVLGAGAAGDLQTAILRLPDFYGPTASNSLAAFALAQMLAGKTADLLAPIDTPHEWVYIPDTAAVIADLLEHADAAGAYNFAGAGTLTVRQFAEKLFAAARRPMKFRAAGPLVVRAMGLFNPLMRELAEMMYLYETPVLLDDAKLRALLGEVRKTSYDDGIRATVAAALAKGTVAA